MNDEQQTNALKATLLFHSASPWTDEKRKGWEAITQNAEATTRILCDTVRISLGLLPSCFGEFCGKPPSELPDDFPVSPEQSKILIRLLTA